MLVKATQERQGAEAETVAWPSQDRRWQVRSRYVGEWHAQRMLKGSCFYCQEKTLELMFRREKTSWKRVLTLVLEERDKE